MARKTQRSLLVSRCGDAFTARQPRSPRGPRRVRGGSLPRQLRSAGRAARGSPRLLLPARSLALLRKVAWVIHHFSFITFFFPFPNKLRVWAEVAVEGGEVGKGGGEGGLTSGKAAVHFPEAAAHTSKAP